MAERHNLSLPNASPYAFWETRNRKVASKNKSLHNRRSSKSLRNKNSKHDISKTTVENFYPTSNGETGRNFIAIETFTQKGEERDKDDDDFIRKNVWSDVDDELYIAKLLESRNANEVKREKRDIRFISDSDFSERVVNSDSLDYDMWELEPTDLTECDCLGPPPEFLLPPPPRPPFLQAEYYCGDDQLSDFESCDIEPKIDAYNHSGPSLQTSAAIAFCSIVLVLGIFVGAILVWKHKRKVTNLLPSKSTGHSQSAGSQRRAPPPAPLYEDLQDLPRRPPLTHRPDLEPQLEMVETKRSGCPGRVFVCGAGNTWRGGANCGGDTCGAPLYEELPHRSDDSLHSDDHFAEDELSLVGEAAPCRTCSKPPPPQSLPHRPRQQRLDRRPKSLDRRRAHQRMRHNHNHVHNHHIHPPESSEFHEGVLLDALLRLYPQVGTVGARPQVPMAIGAGGAWPGGELPGIPCWRGPRASPKPPSGDSSFGSDSGYSNNTCGTCGTRASSRHRLSAEIPMS